MSTDSRHRIPRLFLVDSSNEKSRKWTRTRRKPASQLPSQAIRMAVMPTLSRNLCYAGMAWVWKWVRSYFVNPKPGGAVMLAFPQAGFVSKKASGSIRWNTDCEVAPQEGGRA